MANIIKTSKLKKQYTAEEKEKLPHYCTGCGTRNKENFNKSRNPAHVTGRQPYCKMCLSEIFDKYKKAYKDDYQKIFWYLCRKIDMGYATSGVLGVYTLIENAKAKKEKLSSSAIVGEYMKLANSFGDTQGYPICFDDSDVLEGLTKIEEEVEELEDDIEVTPKLIRDWGNLPPKSIQFLEREYQDWCNRNIVDTKALEVLVRDLCYIQLKIQEAKETGASTSNLYKDFQALLTSANLKPNMQTSADSLDTNCIGMWIKRIEEDEPIPEPTDEFKDPDNILYLIKVFFLGHFAKMQNIQCEVSELYEREMAKYTVDLDGD